MPKLTIDGKEIEVPTGTTIIQAADKLGIDIPRYCYHPALPVSGNCRICMVEVEKMPKPQIACYTQVTDGMVVKTNSPKVLDTRKAVLEFLLVNHPLDCPVCDQAGECKLQDYYMEHGKYNSRLDDVKVKKTKKAFSIGPTIMLDQERCILCTRCVRFSNTITKTNDFGVFNRGDHSELDVVPGHQLDNNYSGNVADICPVGALTDKDFRFKCRVWYLEKTKSVCPGCSNGCNITVEWDKSRPRVQKNGRVMRLKPRLNSAVNSYWMCDTGRYNYRPIDENRILAPLSGNSLTNWDQAYEKVVDGLKAVKDPNRIGVIASPQLTNEDLFCIKKLFKDGLKVNHIDFHLGEMGKDDGFLLKADRNPNTAGCKAILGSPTVDTGAIVQKAKEGQFDILYVFNLDLFKIYGKETLQQIASKTKLFVYQATNINETCNYANLILPGASYAEKDGTFTNVQDRVQRIWPAFFPLGESKMDWEILTTIAKKLGTELGCRKSEDIFNAIAATIPAFAGMTYKEIGDQGMVLKK